MKPFKVASLSPDLSKLNSELIEDLLFQYKDSDVILFPEYLLELFKPQFSVLSQSLVVFGSKIEGNKNQAVLSYGGNQYKVPKICLTPWEESLDPGDGVSVFEYKGVRIALVICFDIEQPYLVDSLKKLNLDLLLVPAATESALGYERVSRCASARSVELGCAVVTCHLIGTTTHKLVDENIGNNHMYLPSQSLFSDEKRYESLNALNEGECLKVFEIPIEKLRRQKTLNKETNPALFKS